jgi:hypothetical protein
MRSIVATLAFLSATPAVAQDEHIGLRVREWFARMGGVIEADDGSGNSTRIDIANDLGLGDRNLTHELQAYLAIPVLGRLYVGWWRAHDEGSETLSRTIDFAGFQFTASTRIDSEVTLDVGYLTYEFAFPTIPAGDMFSLELAVQVGARAIRGEGEISESTGGNTGKDDGTVGLPVLGAHVTVQLFKFIRAEVEIVGLQFSYSDWSLNYLEGYAEVVAQPIPAIFAGVGYKFANIHVQKDGKERFLVDVDVAGVYITAGVRF